MSSKMILTLSDPHLSENRTDQYRHNFFADLPGIIERRKPDALAILGDLTEEKDRHSAKLVNQIVHELDEIAKLVPLLVLCGNHDYENEGHPFFAFIDRIPNIEWVGKVKTGSELSSANFRSIFEGCLFLPHTRNYKRDWADLIKPPKGKLRFNDYRFVFAHNTFNGAEVGWGRKLDGIPLEIFPKGSKVISGDIHVPQTLGPVTYVGAPYTVNFGDDYEPRMLSIRSHTVQSVSVKSWPQKRLVVVDDLGALYKVKGLNAGDIVKVRIGQDDMGNWATIHKDIVAWCEEQKLVLFRAEPILSHKVVIKRVRVRASEATSDETLLRQFAKRHTLEEQTLAVGLELLK